MKHFTLRLLRRKYWLLSLLAVVMIAAGVAWLWWSGVPDPIHEGTRLSTHLSHLPPTPSVNGVARIVRNANGVKVLASGYARPMTNGLSPAALNELLQHEADQKQRGQAARAAIRALGQECFPLLLSYLRQEPSRREKLLAKLSPSVRFWLKRWGLNTSTIHTLENRWRAIAALQELHRAGVDMRPVLPTVVELAQDDDRHIRITFRALLKEIDRPTWWELEMGQPLTNFYPYRR